MAPLLEIDGLVVRRGDREVLHGVSFAVERRDTLAIVGPNGAGKTTLLLAVLGLVPPAAGTIGLSGRPLHEWSRRALAHVMGYVPQSDGRGVSYSVEEFILLGRYAHRGRFTPPGRDDWRVVRDAMKTTGTDAFAERAISSLSGGERQKVSIAAALAQEAEVLLLDEPTAFLDPRHQMETAGLIVELNRVRGLTVIVVTHDINMAVQAAGRVLALREGRAAYYGSAEAFLTSRTLDCVYGVPFDVHRTPDGGAWAVPRLR